MSPAQIHKAIRQKLEFTEDRSNVTSQQIYNWWLSACQNQWHKDSDEFKSALEALRSQNQGYEVLNVTKDVSLAFTTPFFQDPRVCITDVDEAFVDATYQTNKNGYELYAVVIERDLVTVPILYLLLDTRSAAQKARAKERSQDKKNWDRRPRKILSSTQKDNIRARTIHLTSWFNCLKSKGFAPKIIFTDKDMAEIKAIQTV